MDLYLVAFAALAFFIAGFVKGIVGMGLPPISMALLALVMAPAQAAALVLIPSFVTNIWQMKGSVSLLAVTRRFATLLLGIGLGAWLGAGVLTSFESRLPNLLLGVALASHALLLMFAVEFRVKRSSEPFWSPVIGLLSGLVLAATGIMAVPLIPYLYALELNRDELLQTLGVTFVVAAVALALILFDAGLLRITNASGSALALIPTALGMYAGRHMLVRIDPKTFRKLFVAGLFALGAFIAIKAALQ